MNNKYLIVNTGSASKKYALYEGIEEVIYFHLETEEDGFVSTVKISGKGEKVKITEKNFNEPLDYILEILKSKNFVSKKEDIFGVGIRVVAPGTYFQLNRIIDDEYLKNLKSAQKKAPLHLEVIAEEIKKLKSFFGKKMRIVGVSDSEFHMTMPQKAKNYAINSRDASKYEIYRYGYHGISARSIVNKLKEKGDLPKRLIICHLGGGISVMAVKDGMSIDTSMGFTPLEGMVMANRVGDIDAGAVIYLSEVLGLNDLKMLQYLNKKCGIFGLSDGLSNDIRELFKAEEENGDIRASNALETYIYKIQKQIGASFVALGGLDMLVFTATVGERSYRMRHRICRGLESIGISIDQKINECTDGIDCALHNTESKIRVEVVKTEEMNQIAKETEKILA